MSQVPSQPQPPNFLVYQTEDGKTRIDVRLDGQTLWLPQADIAELFQTTPQNITLHIKAIYDEGELDEPATCKDYLQVRAEGKRQVERSIKHYSLDVIIAVGYRVRSHRGTQFRRWATERLKELLVKGFVMDDERLKAGRSLGADYFDELLARIRDIRASEKRFYQKVRDIYALSIDYDPKAPTTQEFFQIVQNKLHWAISGHTAAEIIALRSDSTKPNMGLTTWKGTKVRPADVTIAKNYLSSEEINQLNRLVTMYLDYAEDQAQRQQPLYMKDWRDKLDGFLKFNDRAILAHAGKVSMEDAQKKALEEYERFNQRRLEEDAAKDDDQLDNQIQQIETEAKRRPPKA